jgi:hypothetical protein
LVTTVNSTTLTVDDKNIELGSVVAKASLQATLATGTAVVTLTAGDTKSLIPGMSLTVNVGPGAFGASAVIATVNSLTQFTASVNHAVAGTATFTAGGVSEFTADGGGITVKGTTDKTFNWIRSSGHWTANTNISAPALVSTTATGTAPLTVASTTLVTNLNADLLDGFNSAQASTVSTVAVRDASGDINVRLVRSEFANQATISGAMAFRVNNSTDNYIRFVSDTPAIRTFLNTPTRTGGDASGTWGINITGNAATVTNGVYTTGDQTIGGVKTFSSTIVGSINGNAATATNATNSTYMSTFDDRIKAPLDDDTGKLRFGFTSFANNNTSPYADYLHLRSYTDATGGNDNLVMFRKDAIGMRIYQQGWNSASAYSTFKDIAFTDGTNASGTWGISITGNAATATTASAVVNTVAGTASTSSFATTAFSLEGNPDISVGIVTAAGGFISSASTTPVQINFDSGTNSIIFSIAGIGTTSLVLF